METTNNRICPWWLGYFLINPLRKRIQDPNKIIGPYLKPSMIAIDYGSAMGYFSIPMAKIVGKSGKVYCFDIQKKMLSKLMRRAINAGVENIIETWLINKNNEIFEKLNETVDFGLLFAVAHEVPDKEKVFGLLYSMIKKEGLLLFAEPKTHVPVDDFNRSVSLAELVGFKRIKVLEIKQSHAILLEKI